MRPLGLRPLIDGAAGGERVTVVRWGQPGESNQQEGVWGPGYPKGWVRGAGPAPLVVTGSWIRKGVGGLREGRGKARCACGAGEQRSGDPLFP